MDTCISYGSDVQIGGFPLGKEMGVTLRVQPKPAGIQQVSFRHPAAHGVRVVNQDAVPYTIITASIRG